MEKLVTFVKAMTLAVTVLIANARTAQAQLVRTYNTPSGTVVREYVDRIEESHTSPNGDRNTVIHEFNGHVTTVIDHPDGSREVNGVQTQAPARNPGSVHQGNGGSGGGGGHGSGAGPNERGQGGRREFSGGHRG